MDDARSPKPLEPSRKHYEPPAIEESGGFERLVLACGHTPDQAATGMFPLCEGPGMNS
jgi:hypothetical protein